MLAATVKSVMDVNFPVLASPKIDGYRAMIQNGQVVGRSLKPIPNKLIQRILGREDLNGLDGELVVGNPTDPGVFNRTQRGVSAVETTPNFNFWVFDLQGSDMGFRDRHEVAWARAAATKLDILARVPHTLIRNTRELDEFETAALHQGYEGVMLRHPVGRYKHGRSTLPEGGLMKLKRFDDAEAIVIGAVELMQNLNEAKVSRTGHLERSSHQANMVGKGALGSLQVRGINGPYKGVVFNIGTGFDEALRYELWLLFTIGKLSGRVIKYKYFASGAKDAPRFPVFIGFRPAEDMSS
ncbi:ligase-like protein [Caudoviricetes sp.]|nr:ligase-like protein [Caudoviricetes sp.]